MSELLSILMWAHRTNHSRYQLSPWIPSPRWRTCSWFDEGNAEFTFSGTIVEKWGTVTCKVINSYSGIIMAFCGKLDIDVSDKEYMTFLLYWLNKFIFCSASQAIMKEHIPLAWALSQGQTIALASLVWSHLVQGVKDFLLSGCKSPSGPIWLLQPWL